MKRNLREGTQIGYMSSHITEIECNHDFESDQKTMFIASTNRYTSIYFCKSCKSFVGQVINRINKWYPCPIGIPKGVLK